jgi:NifU-like protein involved in Fe-S cluster formation
MLDFSAKTLEYFRRAQSVRDDSDADAVGTAGTVQEGNLIRIALWMRSGRIVKASARTFGCVSAIAAGCALCEAVQGKTLEEAGAITRFRLLAILGGLPKERRYCAGIAIEALRQAINKFPLPYGERAG